MEQTDLERRFNYHQPPDAVKAGIEDMRGMCLALAEQINDHVPEGREKSTAITKLEEVMFWAVAGMARP